MLVLIFRKLLFLMLCGGVYLGQLIVLQVPSFVGIGPLLAVY